MLPGARLFLKRPLAGRAVKFCISLGLVDVDSETRRPAPDAAGSLAAAGSTVRNCCAAKATMRGCQVWRLRRFDSTRKESGMTGLGIRRGVHGVRLGQ